MKKMKILLMHVPVIHKGYQNLIDRLNPDNVLIVSDTVANQFDRRRKDIRALHSFEIVATLTTLYPHLDIQEFNGSNIPKEDDDIHMPDEDISVDILNTFLSGRKVILESTFLRYASKKSMAPEEVKPDRVVFMDDPAVQAIVRQLYGDAEKSPDWWRQISASIVKDGEVLSLCHNKHVPDDTVTYILGDPRSNATKGVSTNVSKAAHAEPLACFQAGVEGCQGADLVVSTYPCPQCANFVSFTGIKSLFFVEGYAMVNGAEDLRSKGIEIVKIESSKPEE